MPVISMPVFWIEQPQYIVLCVVASTVTFFSVPIIASRLRLLLWADAVGLSLFAVLGAQTALAAEAPLMIAALLGVVSATFGGIIRDIICHTKGDAITLRILRTVQGQHQTVVIYRSAVMNGSHTKTTRIPAQ